MASKAIQIFWLLFPLWSGWNCIWKHGIVSGNTYVNSKKKLQYLPYVKQASMTSQEEGLKVKKYFLWCSLEQQYGFVIYPCTRKHIGEFEPYNKIRNGKRNPEQSNIYTYKRFNKSLHRIK